MMSIDFFRNRVFWENHFKELTDHLINNREYLWQKM